MGWGRKSYLGPAEIASFSSRDFSGCNKHDSFWLVASAGYFYILFLCAIFVSHFLLLEIHKHLLLPLCSITFTANIQADNHFYKCIYLFQILCSMKSFFLSKNTLRFFIFKFGLNVKYRRRFFYKRHGLQ